MYLYKRVISIFLIILFSCSGIYAAYLKNVPQTLTQPDGTVIHCFASGDEYHHWLHDAAEFTIVQDKQTGYFVYAVLSGEELVASPHIVGRVNPEAVGLEPNINISPKTWSAKRTAIEQMQAPAHRHKAIRKNEGLINNIAFFIAFNDDIGYNKTYSFMTEMYNDSSSLEANSLYNYYRIVSYGKMYIKTHFFPAPDGNNIMYYRDIYPRNYYRPASTDNPNGYNGGQDAFERKNELLKRTVEYFKDDIPVSVNLDFNNDNRIDNVCFIVTGFSDGWGDLLWPHRSWLSDSVSINGKRVYDYNFQIEESSNPGVITHEMMHTLSAPDLYHYNYSRPDPIGTWDLMASTNYSSPQGLSAYIKYRYGGWIDSIPEIKTPGTYTLYPANGTSPEKTIYMLRPDDFYDPDAYIVLEYRKTSSNIFEGNLPGSGLLIYRINSKFEGEGNAAYDNETIFDEIYLYRPGGTNLVNGNLDRATFAKDHNRTAFGPITDPFPFNSLGGTMAGILITDITEIGDSIQFTVREQIDTLTIDTEEIVLKCEEGSTSQFRIKSNTTWSIIFVNAPWLSINKVTGKGNATITAQSLSQNTLSTNKTTIVDVDPLSREFSKSIKIYQSPCNTDIVSVNLNATITIFPNPANNRLTILYPERSEFPDIAIYSITGQHIPFTVIERKAGDMTIDISQFSSGIYYLKFTSAKQSTVKSFIVK